MYFERAIVDELGSVIYWCSELEEEQIDIILENHPEWNLRTVEIR